MAKILIKPSDNQKSTFTVAEDTHIFQLHTFQQYIEDKTNIDGSDLGMHLAHLFQVLNTPEDKR